MSNVWMAWVFVFILMSGVWCLFLWCQNPGIIDVFWSVAIGMVAFLYCPIDVGHVAKCVLQCLLLIWALRLSMYLCITRILTKQAEKRYELIAKHWRMPRHLGFFCHFQLQGLLAMGMALPFVYIDRGPVAHSFTIIAVLLIITGLIGASLADYQLHTFCKTQPGKVCGEGLWRYSRHPNYFFEWLIWLGFALPATLAPWGFLGYLSPLLLLCLMCKITIPITEAGSLQSKGQIYRDYQSRTAIFIPWFPMRNK